MRKISFVFVLLLSFFVYKSNAQCNGWKPLGIDDTVQPSFGPAAYTSIATNASGNQVYVAYQDGMVGNKATVVTSNAAPGNKWAYIGTKGFSAGSVQYTTIAISQTSSIPYVAYQDNYSGGKAVVMEYNGSNWTQLGLPVSAGTAQYVSLAVASGTKDTVYVAYRDGANSNRLTVMKYNYTGWVTVGTAGCSKGAASYISLRINNPGTVYVAYSDSAYGGKAVAMSFASGTWSELQATPGGFSKGAAAYISMGISNSKNVYVTYQDLSRADSGTVMEYNGSAWTAIGFPKTAGSPGPVEYNSLCLNASGIVYVGFYDTAKGFASVMAYSGGTWAYEGNPDFSAGAVNYISIASGNSPNNLDIVYQDEMVNGKATVQQFNTQWVNICTQGISGAYAYAPSIAISKTTGAPYAAFSDARDTQRIGVMNYNGSTWNHVGPPVSARKSSIPSLAITTTGIPYVAYKDDSSGGTPLVKMFGPTAWAGVGSPSGQVSASTINYISLAFDNTNKPYVAYDDGKNGGKATVESYNGSAWGNVGAADFSVGAASGVSIAIYKTTPYITFIDAGQGNNSLVYEYTGSAWSDISGGGLSTKGAAYPSIAVDNAGNPYVAYQDLNTSNKGATVYAYFSGTWNALGTPGFTPGSATAIHIALDSLNNPYISFIDGANNNKITVMKYTNPGWIMVGSAAISQGAAINTTDLVIKDTTPYVTYQDRGVIVKKYISSSSSPFSITPALSILCQGSSVQLTPSSTAIPAYSWSPATGLSCTSCSNPIASPTVTTTYTAVNTASTGCNNSAQATVMVSTANDIYTIAGNGTGTYAGNEGTATVASLHLPTSVAFDSSGNMYIADQLNSVIRKVDKNTDIITTVAGIDSTGYSGDNGPATAAKLNWPSCIAFDKSNNLYIADQGNHAIRKVTMKTGIITTIAGTPGVSGYAGDGGAATAAKLNNPIGIAFDASGNLYIADFNNNRIREVTGTTINTVAGNGTAGFVDLVVPLIGELNHPTSVAIDGSGNIYVADQGNHRIRKIALGILISTVAGNGTAGFTGDNGPATSAELHAPIGITLDAAGNKYIADELNHRIREVNTSGTINTIAGNGTGGYCCDGSPATSAELNYPWAVTFDAAGNLYIPDNFNNRVREIHFCATVATTVTASATAVCAGNPDTLIANGAGNYLWSPAASLNKSTGDTVIATPTVTTTYTVYSTSSGSTDSITVKVNPLPVITVTPAKAIECKGNSVTLTASGSSGGYLWSPATGLNSTTGASVTAKDTILTIYNVIGYNSFGCTDSAKVRVRVDRLHIKSIVSNTSCYNSCDGSDTALPVGGVAPYYYLWSAGQTTSFISSLCPGTYSLKVSDSAGCVAYDTATIIHPPPLALTPTVTAVGCNGTSNGTASVSVSGGTSPYTYSWNSSPVQTTATAIGLAAGTYTCTVTDAKGCSNSVTVTLTQSPTLHDSITYTNNLACYGSNTGSAAVGVKGGIPPYTYLWSPSGGTKDTATNLIAGSYTCTITDNGGCTGTATVTVSQPSPVVVCCDSTIQAGQSVQLSVSPTSSSYSYTWSPSTGLSCSTCPIPTASPTVSTIYYVTATDTSNGCSVIDSVTITVDGGAIHIYTGISPNGDGHNDTWVIDNINEYPDNSVSIYNRWGIEVWHGDHYNNTNVVWKGYDSANQPLPDGTYFYIVKIGNTIYKGWVELTR